MTKRKLCYWLAIVSLAAGGVSMFYAALYYRLTHPAMTETQLFLSNWEAVVAGVVLLIVGYVLAVEADKYED